MRVCNEGGKLRQRGPWWVVLIATLLIAACGPIVGRDPNQGTAIGDPARGQQMIAKYGCNSCHIIPGLQRTGAMVGPPLNDWADRHYIAGNLANTPENLIFWIRFPQSVEPGTVMPDMGVTENDANDIAAYLFTLRQRSRFQFPPVGENREDPFNQGQQ